MKRSKTVTMMTFMLILAAIVGLSSAVAPRAEADSCSQTVEKIAFASTRDGNGEIYVMDADGSNQTRLTNNAADDFDPAFSPDGTKIAFVSDRDGFAEIYVMDANGFNQTRLTNNATPDIDPAFSPDGTKIAFVSTRDGNTEIYVMNTDGTSQINLTNNAATDIDPAFSPDGTEIAFESNRDGNGEIYVMNTDGTSPTNLTNNTARDFTPSFSPDGTKIAFVSTRDGNTEIYVMNTDGTSQINLTNNTAGDFTPSFSPDGTKIAFRSSRDTNDEIYVMNADGTGQTNLTNNTAGDVEPSWGKQSISSDQTPPTITLTSGVLTLHPPNHNYITFPISALASSASDSCDSSVDLSKVVIANVTSDEPEDAKGNGDGNTRNDIVIPDCHSSVQLRAERADQLDGRVYKVTLRVKDVSENVGSAVREVLVPVTKGGSVIDSGVKYIVSGCSP